MCGSNARTASGHRPREQARPGRYISRAASPAIAAVRDGQPVLRKPGGHRIDQEPRREPTTDPIVASDAAATGRGRVVDLTAQIGPG
jgi:hypothetical protein